MFMVGSTSVDLCITFSHCVADATDLLYRALEEEMPCGIWYRHTVCGTNKSE